MPEIRRCWETGTALIHPGGGGWVCGSQGSLLLLQGPQLSVKGGMVSAGRSRESGSGSRGRSLEQAQVRRK